MAKTFIGELILRFKDESAAGAKKSAADISGSLSKIEAAAKRLNSMPWGGQFTKQLDKLGASSKDMDKLRSAWDRLYEDMQSKNLSKALQKSELGNWKNSALQHFVAQQKALRDELDKSEKRARSWRDNMQSITKAGLSMMGAAGGAYGAYVLGKGGIEASAEWEREKFRLRSANYGDEANRKLIGNAETQSTRYPALSATQLLEMGKASVAATGNVDEGMSITEFLAKAQTVLSASGKSVNVADEMAKFVKGGELSGLIKPGPGGTDRFKTVLENWTKYSQIEGAYMSMSDFFTMARTAKGSLMNASDDFLAMAPGLGVEMGPPGFGTGLSALSKSLLGLKGGPNGKAQLEEQERLGIRGKNGIVGREEFQENPFLWAQKYLIPALTKDGVNVDKAGDVNFAIDKMIGAPKAQQLLKTLINNRGILQKSIDQRTNAMGFDAVDQVRQQDPFTSWLGFVNSLKNLASAVGEGPMEGAVKGLNAMTDGINRMQLAWRDGGAMAKLGIGTGVGLGVLGTFKAISGVYALATAGPALTAAAASLEVAAARLGTAGVAGNVADATNKSGGLLGTTGTKVAGVAGVLTWWELVKAAKEQGQHQTRYQADMDSATHQRAMIQSWFSSGKPAVNDPILAGQRAASGGANPLQAAVDGATRGLTGLNATVAPKVDTSSIKSATAEIAHLLGLLGQVGAKLSNLSADIPHTAATSVSRSMNRSFADIGLGN